MLTLFWSENKVDVFKHTELKKDLELHDVEGTHSGYKLNKMCKKNYLEGWS